MEHIYGGLIEIPRVDALDYLCGGKSPGSSGRDHYTHLPTLFIGLSCDHISHIPSGSLCLFEESILARDHQIDLFIYLFLIL